MSALTLIQETRAPVAQEDPQQYLTFMLGRESFALGILRIKEIIEYAALTSVPMMPPFIRGILNLRGAVIPVVDLPVRFGRPASDITRKTCIVIVEVEAASQMQDLGIVVDSVNEVLEILPEHIEPAPVFGSQVRSDFIDGIGKVRGQFLVILNIDRVLSVDELASLVGEPEEAGA